MIIWRASISVEIQLQFVRRVDIRGWLILFVGTRVLIRENFFLKFEIAGMPLVVGWC